MAKSKLQETIQNYYNVGALMDESDLQMLEWLEELRDLRKILSERSPEEKAAEDRIAKYGEMALTDELPLTLVDYISMMDPMLPDEEQIHIWAEQLLKARDRIGDD